MQPTRRKIVELIKERGQATVVELADAVGLTHMAVRHHLNVLYGDRLVTSTSVERKNRPGRPRQLYTLTEAANQFFPEDYYHLAVHLLDEIKAALGKAGLDELLRRIAAKMAAEAAAVTANKLLEERLAHLAHFLSDKGFTARCEAKGDAYVVRLLTCPYRKVAQKHKEVCCLDRRIIKQILRADPVQMNCIASGDKHCTFRIRHSIPLMTND